MSDESAGRWTIVASTTELRRRRKLVVDADDGEVVVFWNGGEPAALANICIHRDRELSRGNIFQDRLVCPGHQWAFDLKTGFCAERERTQPIYDVRLVGDDVMIDTSGPINGVQVTPRAAPEAETAGGGSAV